MPQGFPYRAVIFDMDGVIVDTEMGNIGVQVDFGRHLGLEVSPESLMHMVGTSVQVFRAMLVDWFEQAGQGCLTEDEAEARFGAWYAGRVPDYAELLNPGVHETLAELRRRGVRVALASSSRMETIDAVLRDCDLEGAFEIIVSGEQFKESKPNPEIYLHALELLQLEAGECCCVEDSVPGIAAGKAAGLTVFAKREDRFGFSQDEADEIIDQIPNLLDFA